MLIEILTEGNALKGLIWMVGLVGSGMGAIVVWVLQDKNKHIDQLRITTETLSHNCTQLQTVISGLTKELNELTEISKSQWKAIRKIEQEQAELRGRMGKKAD